jgi:hypothetical protein
MVSEERRCCAAGGSLHKPTHNHTHTTVLPLLPLPPRCCCCRCRCAAAALPEPVRAQHWYLHLLFTQAPELYNTPDHAGFHALQVRPLLVPRCCESGGIQSPCENLYFVW